MDNSFWHRKDENSHQLIQRQAHTSALIQSHQSEDFIKILGKLVFNLFAHQAVEEHHHRNVWSKGCDKKAWAKKTMWFVIANLWTLRENNRICWRPNNMEMWSCRLPNPATAVPTMQTILVPNLLGKHGFHFHSYCHTEIFWTLDDIRTVFFSLVLGCPFMQHLRCEVLEWSVNLIDLFINSRNWLAKTDLLESLESLDSLNRFSKDQLVDQKSDKGANKLDGASQNPTWDFPQIRLYPISWDFFLVSLRFIQRFYHVCACDFHLLRWDYLSLRLGPSLPVQSSSSEERGRRQMCSRSRPVTSCK